MKPALIKDQHITNIASISASNALNAIFFFWFSFLLASLCLSVPQTVNEARSHEGRGMRQILQRLDTQPLSTRDNFYFSSFFFWEILLFIWRLSSLCWEFSPQKCLVTSLQQTFLSLSFLADYFENKKDSLVQQREITIVVLLTIFHLQSFAFILRILLIFSHKFSLFSWMNQQNRRQH